MPEYSGLFRKMPDNTSGMDFTLKCRHFPNPDPQTLLENPPSRKVKLEKNFQYCYQRILDQPYSVTIKTVLFIEISIKNYIVGKCHPAVKPCLNSDRDIPRIPVKNKVLTGTYILQTE